MPNTLKPEDSALPRFYECGICEQYHSVDFDGDCRQDDAQFNPEDLDAQFGINGWEIVDMPTWDIASA